MLDISYCASDETLDMCKTCRRNDKNKVKAVEASAIKSGIYMIKANPRLIDGVEEKCNLYLKEKQ